MAKKNKNSRHFFTVIATLLITCTIFSSAVWAAILKPSTPNNAAVLWDKSTAASDTNKVHTLNSDDLIKADYFGAKCISGITVAEPFGPWDDLDVTRTNYNSETVTSKRIPANDASYKNQLGVWYRNVGNYQGRSIDLKATLTDYEFYSNDGITSQMILWARKDKIGFCVAGESWIDIKYEFFDSTTGEAVSLKAYMTFDDVDWGQAIEILQNPGELYVPSDSNLRCIAGSGSSPVFLSDGAWYPDSNASHASSPADSFMTMFEGNYQLQRFYCCYYFREDYVSRQNFLIDYSDEVSLQTFCNSLDYFGYSGLPLAPTVPSTPTKQVSDQDETGVGNTLTGISESFTYSIYHNVPNENPEHYYNSYTLTDALPECLELISVNIYDETQQEITDDFSTQTDQQTVFITALNPARADFYYDTYRFDLHVKIRQDADLTPFLVTNDEGDFYYQFSNQAYITIERNGIIQKDSNQTTTRLKELYSQGMVKIHKFDAISQKPLSNAVFTLYEWDQFKETFVEQETLFFDKEETCFYSSPLSKNSKNLGRYKVIETKVPEKYEGAWEQELELTEDGQLFEFEVENMPLADHTITKTVSVVNGENLVHINPGTKSAPESIQQGDLLEYHIDVVRDCAPGYKSGTFTITDSIPKNCIWSKETLKLAGQITNASKNSTASIDSMKVEKDTITWTISDLDNGEGVSLSFQVQAPKQKAAIENTAYLNLPDESPIPSNTTYHQTPESVTPVKSIPASNEKGKTGSTALPVETGDDTHLYTVLGILFFSGISIFLILSKKHSK